MIKVVFAYAPGMNGNAFGNGDSLPWPHQKDDMKMFMETTKDSVCVMGCKTWESLPKSLPNRVNVVLARPYLPENKSGEVPDMVMHGDLRAAIYDLQTSFPDKDICIIGGLSIIEEAIGFADQIVVTRIKPRDIRGFDADVFVNESILGQIMNNNHSVSTKFMRTYTEQENKHVHTIVSIEYTKIK